MKIHVRYEPHGPQHCRVTFFINGQNTGTLTMDPDAAASLQMIISGGCADFDEFVSSGTVDEERENGHQVR